MNILLIITKSMNFRGNSIKCQRKAQIAKISKSREANLRIYGSSGGLFEGGGNSHFVVLG